MARTPSLALPSGRTVALLCLLVVGVAGSVAFHAAMTDTQVTYTATAVQPGDDPSRVAHASRYVADLGARLDGKAIEVRRPVEDAARSGSFTGNVSPELYVVLDDLDARYVVYGGSYYRWNATVADDTTYVAMQMTPAPPAAVFDAVSTPARTAPPGVREAIDAGAVTDRILVETGVYHRGDGYYVVAPERTGALAANLVGAVVGYVLTPVGRGYVAVALGLLLYRFRDPSADRVLTVRRSLVVAALGVPVALAGTALFERGSLTRFLTSPASTVVVSAGVVAGVLVHRRCWARLAGWTALVVVASVGASVLALGPVGLVFGGVKLLVGLFAGAVTLGLGAWFGAERGGPTVDGADR